MTPAAEQAEYIAQALCPGTGLTPWQVSLLAAIIVQARGEGAAEAEAALQPTLDAAVNCSERSASLAAHAAKRAWHAMLVAFGLLLYNVLQLVMP